MTTQTEALKHLKAITEAFGPDAGIELDQKAWEKLHAAIKEVLAQPEQEPVAWELGAEVYWGDSPELSDYVRKEGTPLYTTAPQRKPLTDEQIDEIWRTHLHRDSRVRAVEAAHGIKGDA